MTLDEWNARYRAGEFSMEPAEHLLDYVRDVPPGRALDLACGAGRNAMWLAERGWDVVAIDGATEAIRLLRHSNESIDARVMDLERTERLPFDDQSFDLVMILYFLHRPLFAEARRVLRAGGWIVIATKTTGAFALEPNELLRMFTDYMIQRWVVRETAELIAQKTFIHSKT